MKKMTFGVIGLGLRGTSILKNILLNMEDVEVVAVCDQYADRTEKSADRVQQKCGKRPFETTDYKTLLAREGIDAVYVASDWETHVEIAVDALKAGIPTALEVGGAYSIESLWTLVRAQETSGTPLMFMENCCFGRSELLVTALVRHGFFGDVVHCHGAYAHYLAEEIAGGEQNRHYRLRNYLSRNCENYPTHELGPIARLFNINRGNQMVTLVSVASRAAGMEDYIAQNADKYPELVGKKFRQGDIVNTLITCADGSTISLKLDTTLPRSYSREFTVHGTRGMYEMNNNMIYLAGEPEAFSTAKFYHEHYNSIERFADDYLHPVWNEMTPESKRICHGGMDWIELRVFFDALRENRPI
ncbi:MAG: Gfo/Idh/MocA family oxidoreductase, partial [Clostridia bacterium]|nr:Gfo/Idh/MocA family oxidoreductase [Clostridia bacterium]